MSTIKETSIIRPPFGETTVDIVGLETPAPHYTDIYTDEIIPPSGTLHIAGDVIVDGSVTCNPIYVDNVYAKTAGGNVTTHNTLELTSLSLGGNAATMIDTDVTLATSSNSRIPTQHAVKNYIDTHAGTGLTFNTPLRDTAGTISLINSAAGTVTSVSIDGTMAANSDTVVPTQRAIRTYADALASGVTETISGTATFYANGDIDSTTVDYVAVKVGDIVSWYFTHSNASDSFGIFVHDPLSVAGPIHATIPVPLSFVPMIDGETIYTQCNPFAKYNVEAHAPYTSESEAGNCRIIVQGAGAPNRITIQIYRTTHPGFPTHSYAIYVSLFQFTYVHN